MNVIFLCDIFEYYFRIKQKNFPSQSEVEILNVFQNPKNRFVVSENYVELLRNNFNNAPDTYEFIEMFFMELFDSSLSDRLVIIPDQNKCTAEDEFIRLSTILHSEPTLRIAKSSSPKLLALSNILFVDNPEHFNTSNSIKLHLASRNNHQLRYFDFHSKKEVDDFILNFIRIDEEIKSKTIHIFCRDFSIDTCGHFDIIRSKRYDINFYSRSFKNVERKEQFMTEELQVFNKRLHAYFGSNFTLYLASHVNLIHERMVIIGGLILTLDDDFNNTDPSRFTWSLSIEYSISSALLLLQKAGRFREFRLRA
ncbi:hypothetical protein [Hymenobacter sediminicola]|uniref:Uncharacterized protein n=1 Tax=Hymenobacter sediminicola TaxID=2761579 RepID=A0A7G7W8Q0_9BACT|nr:hypothetical protein [Hymenobacter sediminicola]QNH62743.1 hypothetical protein H4317_02655 [Hymenobacter sediminicola]